MPGTSWASHFERCWGWIEPALRCGNDRTLSKEALWETLETNRAQLWPGERSALVTELVNTPEGRFVHCWLGGGDIAEMVAMKVGVEAWARALGCEFASIDGRRGWLKVFPDYHEHGSEFRKKL